MAVLAVVSAALGSNFGPLYMDGYYVEHYQDLTADFETAHDYARNSVYSPTDMYHPQTSLHAAAHVHAYDLDLGDTGYFGTESCGTADGDVCLHAHIKYNLWPGLGWTAAKRRSVACHETGHAVGLRHYNVYTSSCMVQYLASHDFPQILSAHDKSHINGWY